MSSKSCLWKHFQLSKVVPLKDSLTDFVLDFERELEAKPVLWILLTLDFFETAVIPILYQKLKYRKTTKQSANVSYLDQLQWKNVQWTFLSNAYI